MYIVYVFRNKRQKKGQAHLKNSTFPIVVHTKVFESTILLKWIFFLRSCLKKMGKESRVDDFDL